MSGAGDSVFVTGGTGHLGPSLLDALLAAGYRVRVLTRHPDRHPWLCDRDVQVVAGNVEARNTFERALARCRYVVHAAGRFSFWGAPESFARTNLHGTLHMLDAARAAGVERFIQVSTVAVIGDPEPGRVIDENCPARPADPYQRSKLEGERVALQFARTHGLPVIVLRPGAFYGPHGRYGFNRLFIEDPLKGLRIQVQDGQRVIFPAYVGDVAAGIVAALTLGRPGETYNLSGESIRHRDANRIVSEEAGIHPFRLSVPGWSMIALAAAWTALSRLTRVEPYYPLNLRSYVFNDWTVSSDKARRELDFRPLNFREGVRRTLAWYREQGVWFVK
ncbi:MAG: NAD-dependent epimerase/dehydratase family protein [Anaerolineae bacterium]|nr:NAD-dependent epimerase/dehydratase family protein [Anaerolineae bacterium]